MGDYIEKQEAIDAAKHAWAKGLEPTQYIEQILAADVRPVVRGRWIEKPYLLGTTNVCSVCGENYGMPHGQYNFCPNCGADMRGESGSEE